jgi:hypothetical protein
MRVIGHEQRNYGYESVDAGNVADLADISDEEWPALIEKGVAAGYLEEDENGWLALSPTGWAWYEKHTGKSRHDLDD